MELDKVTKKSGNSDQPDEKFCFKIFKTLLVAIFVQFWWNFDIMFSLLRGWKVINSFSPYLSVQIRKIHFRVSVPAMYYSSHSFTSSPAAWSKRCCSFSTQFVWPLSHTNRKFPILGCAVLKRRKGVVFEKCWVVFSYFKNSSKSCFLYIMKAVGHLWLKTRSLRTDFFM